VNYPFNLTVQTQNPEDRVEVIVRHLFLLIPCVDTKPLWNWHVQWIRLQNMHKFTQFPLYSCLIH